MQAGDDGTELLLTGVEGAEFDELPECAPAAGSGATATQRSLRVSATKRLTRATRRLGVSADGEALLRQERYDWSHIPNLDTFFVRLYVYFTDKGFVCSLVRAPEQLPPRCGA
jgi:hypothetical protein